MTSTEVLKLLLNHIDYEKGACRINEPIGGVLPVVVLWAAREAASKKHTPAAGGSGDSVTSTDATRRHALLNILAGHCGEMLTPDMVEQIAGELYAETTQGATAWAFGQPVNARCLACDGTLSLAHICEVCAERYL